METSLFTVWAKYLLSEKKISEQQFARLIDMIMSREQAG